MKFDRDRISRLIKRLYRVTSELEGMFPGRPFTVDGHLVGSLGEVVAAHDYDLDLLEPSSRCHDARRGRVCVQIKTTQRGRVALHSRPQRLLVIRLKKDGTTEEIYNGPGYIPWRKAGRRQKNGQKSIGVSTLGRLMHDVLPGRRIRKR